MKLYYSPTSPYVRKVRVLMHERGLEADLIPASFSSPETAKNNPNPLGKIPALETDDGELLFDSRVICAYVDTLGETSAFIPLSHTPKRFDILRAEALADGIMDVAVGNVFERMRTDADPSDFWMARRESQIWAGIETANAMHVLDGDFGFNHIAIGCALDYVNFRHGHLKWEQDFPDLYAKHQALMQRDSFTSTAPPH